MELAGTIENIIYRNAENGWTVMEIQTESNERVSVVGVLPLCSVGERLELTGSYATHPKYGHQFKAQSYKTIAPSTLTAIENYLASGVIKGIGASTARSIVAAFGMETLAILDEHPERLSEISGIGKKRCLMIAESYRGGRNMRDILLALEPYGVSVNQAMKLYAIYGNLCMARLQENPYQIIADVDGVGFVTADKIAQNVAGFSADSEARLKAGILYALNQARQEFGHTFLPKEQLLQYTCRLLGVLENPVSEALDTLIGTGQVVYQMVGDTDGIFLPALQQMESEIAHKLIDLSEKPIDSPFVHYALDRKHGDLTLAPQQEAAVRASMQEGVLVITGGPGTGKTTIIKYIVGILEELSMDFALTAPTGRAAKRMSEATDGEAKTLHRLLEYVPGEGFLRNKDNPLFYDMIIVDEMSMVDVPLFHALLKAIPQGTRLIMVGDSDQLPPVGAGDALSDMIKSQVVPVIRLTEIFRQAQESMIVTNAHRINRGEMPLLHEHTQDFLFYELYAQEQILQMLIRLVTSPESPLTTTEPLLDVQVLAPMKKGILGVHSINARLQAVLNPPSAEKAEKSIGESVIFREGDRIMQIKNNYKISWTRRGQNGTMLENTGVFNGDLGTVYQINASLQRLYVLFDDDRLAGYDFAQLEELELAYCISIHKSQGSEFPIVLLPLSGGNPQMLTRNLLYTAVSRAKRQVCCIGSEDTIRYMVDNNQTMRRYTALATRLTEWKDLLG